MFEGTARDPDLPDRNHVKWLELLISFRFELSSIRGILPNRVHDHVIHVYEHIKLKRDHVKLCGGFPAQPRCGLRILAVLVGSLDCIGSSFYAEEIRRVNNTCRIYGGKSQRPGCTVFLFASRSTSSGKEYGLAVAETRILRSNH